MFLNLRAFRCFVVDADEESSAPVQVTKQVEPSQELSRGNERFMAYFNRVARVLQHGVRYVAYSSDIGESFRPVANPMWVNASYAVAAAYIAGDVAYRGYQANMSGKSNTAVARVVCETTTFQLFASLLIPSVIIHTAVHQSQKVFRSGPLKRWGPVATGLALIPFMPYFDEPVEHATEYIFDAIWPADEDSVEQQASQSTTSSAVSTPQQKMKAD